MNTPAAKHRFADMHTHTKLCGHATGEPKEYLEAAIRNGLSFYGISDHLPSPEGFDQESRMMMLEYPHYREIVRSMREEAEGTGLEVLYGCELDYVPGRMREVADFVLPEHFDYMIGSVHSVTDFLIDDPANIPKIKAYGVDKLWEDYIEMLCELVTGFPIQILGHVDLPKKFNLRHSDSAVLHLRIQSLFELCAEKNVMVEINTAGLRKPVREIYPSLTLLKLAKDAGVNITFGSDAHAPCDIAADFDTALALARAAGFRSAFALRKTNPIELPFD